MQDVKSKAEQNTENELKKLKTFHSLKPTLSKSLQCRTVTVRFDREVSRVLIPEEKKSLFFFLLFSFFSLFSRFFGLSPFFFRVFFHVLSCILYFRRVSSIVFLILSFYSIAGRMGVRR